MNSRPEAKAFLEAVVAKGTLSPEGAARVSHALAQTVHAFDTIVTELGLMRETELADALASFLAVERFDSGNSVNLSTAESCKLSFLKHNALFPVSLDSGRFQLALADPFAVDAIKALSFFLDREAQLVLATRSEILALLRQFEEQQARAAEPLESGLPLEADGDDLERLRDSAREAPIIRSVAKMIDDAVDFGATDIHVEPQEEQVRIRFRRDGTLSSTQIMPKAMHAAVISRIKILSQLNIAERRLPQDGRMRVSVKGQNVDLRVSVVPSVFGESVVLRILDRSRVKLDLAHLGFDDQARAQLSAVARSANGIVLVTGPTGSGKTTTLYSMLVERNQPDVKIFTVEDPIEYRLPGVTQLQVEPGIGLDFATSLRSVLRQDPDIILVGEIRDRETADIALRAALTGHLVLSTLHTNDAAGAFTRLRDLGLESFLLSATIRCVVGQRLVRRLCQACHGNKCQECHRTGYRGRVVAYEILQVSEQIGALVSRGANDAEIKTLAVAQGMTPISDHARLLVETGSTSIAEVSRSFDLAEVV